MRDHQHPIDQFNIDGKTEYREPITIEGNQELAGNHIGSICVHAGATFSIPTGIEHIGSLTFQPGSTGYILGNHTGTITVKPGATVEIRRAQQNGNIILEGTGSFYASPTAVVNGILYQQ